MPTTPAPPKALLDAAIRTDIGPRHRNEDAAFASDALLITADGVGGAPAGHRASTAATEAVAKSLRTRNTNAVPVGDLLNTAFSDAHAALAHHADEHPTHDGLATTLSVVLIDQHEETTRAIAAWVGDSPIWHLRPGSPDPMRRLGGDPTGPDGRLSSWLSNTTWHAPRLASVTLETGDWLLVASDGIHALTDDQILDLVDQAAGHRDPVRLAADLVAAVGRAGAVDNVTVAAGTVCHRGQAVSTPTAPCLPELPDTPNNRAPMVTTRTRRIRGWGQCK